MHPSSRITLRDLRDRVTKVLGAIEGSRITNEMCEVVLEILMEMQSVSVSVEDLSATQVGKVVNNVRTIFGSSNDVVSVCKALTDKWKGTVLEHRQNIKDQLRRRSEGVKDGSTATMLEGSSVSRKSQDSLDNDTASTEADNNLALSSHKENFASLHSGYTTSTLPYYKDLLSRKKRRKNPPLSQSSVVIKQEPVSDDEGEINAGSSHSDTSADVSCGVVGAGVTEVKSQRAAVLQKEQSANFGKKATGSRPPASRRIETENHDNRVSENSQEAITESTELVSSTLKCNKDEDIPHKTRTEHSTHTHFILNQSKILERSEPSYDSSNTHGDSNCVELVPQSEGVESFEKEGMKSAPVNNAVSTDENGQPKVDDVIGEDGSGSNTLMEDESNEQVCSQTYKTDPHAQVKKKKQTSYASSILELKSIVWSSIDTIVEVERKVSILKESFRRAQNEINRLTQMCPELQGTLQGKKKRKRKKSVALGQDFSSFKRPNHGRFKARRSNDRVDGHQNETSLASEGVEEGAEAPDFPRDNFEVSASREEDSSQINAPRDSADSEGFDGECRGSVSIGEKHSLNTSISSLTGNSSTPQPSISSTPIVHAATPVPVKRRVPLLDESLSKKENDASGSSEPEDMLCFTQVVDDMETSRELPPTRAGHLRNHKQKYRRFWNQECKKKSGLHYSSLAKNGGVGALKAIHERHVARQAIQWVLDKQVKDRIARMNSLP